MNSALGNRRLTPLVSALAALTAVLALALTATVWTAAAAEGPAVAAKAKKKQTKKKKPAPARTCGQAVTAVNRALEARAVPRYRLKKARTKREKSRYKKQVRAADKKVAAARAKLKVLCAGSGSLSTLDSACFTTVTKLEKLIDLQYARKVELKKYKKARTKKAKQRRKVLTKRLKQISTQVKSQTTTFAKACGADTPPAPAPVAPTTPAPTPPTTPTTPPTPSDTTPPAAPRMIGPNGTTSNSRPSYTITPPEGETGGRIECSVDNGAWLAAGENWTAPQLADGKHTIACRYVDAAGNAGDVTGVVVTVDTVLPAEGPQISIDGLAPDGATSSQDLVVELTAPAGEDGGWGECKVTAADENGDFLPLHDFAPVEGSWEVSMPKDGSYQIICRWIDLAGNVGSESTFALTVDTVAPDPPTLSGPAGPTTDTTPQINVETAELGGTIRCALDGGEPQVVTTAFSTEPLTDGTHTLSCTQTDAAGNESEAGELTLEIDTTAPDSVTISAPPSPTNDATPSFSLNGAGEGERYQCRLDAGDVLDVSGSVFTTEPLADGSHTLECWVIDAAGNLGEASEADVQIDTTPPAAAPSFSLPSGPSNLQSVSTTLLAPAGESAGNAECRISGSGYSGEFDDFSPVASSWTLPGLADGSYEVACRWSDPAGNKGPQLVQPLLLDRVAPVAPGVSGPAGPTSNATPQISVTGAEPAATIRCVLDGGEPQVVGTAFNTEPLTDGTHTLSCTQTDAAGNESAAGSATFSVDTTPPGAVGISGPAGATSDSTPSFNLDGAADGERYQCRVDGGALADVSGSTFTTPPLADGSHVVDCRIVDTAGNQGPLASASVLVDTAAPGTVTISAVTPTSSTTPTVTLSASEGNGQIECKLDGGSFAARTSPWTLPSLSEGSHSIVCRYVKTTGVSGAETSFTLVVDTTPPAAVTIDGPSGFVRTTTPTWTLGGGAGGSLQCRIDSGAWTTTGSSFTPSPALSQGVHEVTCRSIDAAGNSSALVSRSVTVDTIAPVATIADGSPRWDGRHDFTIGVNESGATVRCRIDGGAETVVSGSWTSAALANGSHTISCVATDAAGNVAAPVTKSFNVLQEPFKVSKSDSYDSGVSLSLPVAPNGVSGSYTANVTASVSGLRCWIGQVTYKLTVKLDGSEIGSKSSGSVNCWTSTGISTTINGVALSAASAHTITATVSVTSGAGLWPAADSSSISLTFPH